MQKNRKLTQKLNELPEDIEKTVSKVIPVL